jgi:hypothetical protein
VSDQDRSPGCGSVWSPPRYSALYSIYRCAASAASTSWPRSLPEHIRGSLWWPRMPGVGRSYWAAYTSAGVRLGDPRVSRPSDVPRLPTIGPAADLYADQLDAVPGPRSLRSRRTCDARSDTSRGRSRAFVSAPSRCEGDDTAQIGAALSGRAAMSHALRNPEISILPGSSG